VVDGFNSTSKEEYLVDNSSNYFSLGASTFATDTVDVYLETDPFGKRNIKLNKVRFYDGANDAINNPALFYGVKKYGGQSVLLATFNGADYLAWKETAVTDTSTWKKFYLRKLHVNDQANYSRTEPGKIELVGDYNNDSIYFASYIVRTKPTFRTMNGANNDWSKVGKPSDMKQKSVLFPNAPKMSRNRFYLDMCQHFYPGDSTWFNYYDSVFKWVSESGSDINVCLKSMPVDWVQANYPQTINGNNIWPDASSCLNVLVPAPWGTDWTDPNNYRKIAEYCFQIAGRYGHNANISESLRKSKKKYTGGTLIQPWQDADAPVWGLGYVKYMSPGNENDKSWFPDRRWILQKGDELMAEMSACYDGNMGAMGPGVGIKTADPTMIVLPPAYTEAGKSDNYLRIGRKWVIEHRGYKADGVTPNWPFDEMDFHNYSSDVGGQHNQTTGKAHEKSVAFGEVDTVLKFLGAYANSMPANITETGYDTKDTVLNSVRQGTIQNVPFISGKTVYETQADLNSRMALVNWAKGISAIDFYQMYDDDDANRYLSLYGSCGLFFSENQGYWSGVNGAPKNKPSGNFVVQLKNLLGDYVVDTLNRAGDLWTIKAVKADTTKYIVWMGTENGSTQAATLPITQGVKYDLDYNSETPSQTNITSASVYNFTATEKPAVFLVGPAPAGGNGNGNGFGWKKHFAAKRGKKIVVRQVF
jgi:endoglucanase